MKLKQNKSVARMGRRPSSASSRNAKVCAAIGGVSLVLAAVPQPVLANVIGYNFTANTNADIGNLSDFTSISGVTVGGSPNTTFTQPNTTSASSGYTTNLGGAASGTGNIQNQLGLGTSTAYLQFSLTPGSSTSTYTFNELDFGERSTGTGPKSLSVVYSFDSTFATSTTLYTTAVAADSTYRGFNGTFSSSINDSNGAAIYFRITGTNGTSANNSSSSANFRLDDVFLGYNITTASTGTASGILTYDPAGTGAPQFTTSTTVKDFTDSGLGTDVSFANGNTVNFTEAGITNPNITIASGGVAPAATNVSNTDGTYTFSGGPIAGSGGLTKSGAGTLVLTAANTYTGGTVLGGGVLSVASDSYLGATTSGLTFNGGTLTFTTGLTSARTIALSGSGTVDVGANNSTLSGVISGSGAFVKNGSGTLSLTNANTYSGGTTINAGTLSVAAGSLGTGTVTINGATLVAAGTNAIAGGLTVGSAGATVDTGANTLFLSGNLVGGNANSATASAYTLTKLGTGALTLGVTTSGSYLGGLNVSAGNLSLVGNTAAPKYISQNADVVLTGNLAIGGNGSQAVEYEITRNGATVSGSGTLTINPNSQLVAYGSAANNATIGTVTAPVTLVTDGTSVPTVAGAAYGTLNVNSSITGSSGVQFGNTTTFNGTAGTFGAVNSGSLTGKVVLNGVNSYTGNTTIADGTVVAGSTNSTGTGTVTINAPFSANGTMVSPTLAGTGTVVGPVIVNGTITAGSGATASDTIGQLTTGNETFNSNGTFTVKVNSSAYDKLAIGTLNLVSLSNSSTAMKFNLNLVSLGSAALNGTYVLAQTKGISYFGGTAGDGTDLTSLFNLELGGTLDTSSDYTVTSVADSGYGGYDLDLTYSPAPEPTTAALTGLGLAAIAGRRRRVGVGGDGLLKKLGRALLSA